MKDMYNEIKPLDAPNDAVIDTAEFESVTFVYNITTAADVAIQEADATDGTFTDVAVTDYLGKPIAVADGTGVKKFGYIGNKRFLKVSAGADVTGFCVLGTPRYAPTK